MARYQNWHCANGYCNPNNNGHSNVLAGEDCALMVNAGQRHPTLHGTWVDSECRTPRAYACSGVASPAPLPPPPPGAPPSPKMPPPPLPPPTPPPLGPPPSAPPATPPPPPPSPQRPPPPPPSPPPPSPPFSGFLLVDTPRSWYGALMDCTARGGSLAHPHSAEHNEELAQMVRGPTWIGISSGYASGWAAAHARGGGWVWAMGGGEVGANQGANQSANQTYANWQCPEGGGSHECAPSTQRPRG